MLLPLILSLASLGRTLSEHLDVRAFLELLHQAVLVAMRPDGPTTPDAFDPALRERIERVEAELVKRATAVFPQAAGFFAGVEPPTTCMSPEALAELGELADAEAPSIAAMVEAMAPFFPDIEFIVTEVEADPEAPALPLAEHLHIFDGDPIALRLVMAALLEGEGVEPELVFGELPIDGELLVLGECADVDELIDRVDALRPRPDEAR